jgi:hypothetical protein
MASYLSVLRSGRRIPSWVMNSILAITAADGEHPTRTGVHCHAPAEMQNRPVDPYQRAQPGINRTRCSQIHNWQNSTVRLARRRIINVFSKTVSNTARSSRRYLLASKLMLPEMFLQWTCYNNVSNSNWSTFFEKTNQTSWRNVILIGVYLSHELLYDPFVSDLKVVVPRIYHHIRVYIIRSIEKRMKFWNIAWTYITAKNVKL